MMKTVMKAGPLNVLNIKRGDKTMLLSSFLITFGLFLIIILIVSALVSDNIWLAISAGVFLFMVSFGAMWWVIYTGMAS